MSASDQRFDLVWPGKYDAEGRRRAVRRLDARAERFEQHGAGGSAASHVWFGDNLDVLSALAETHAGKVDLVYIDPPFSTGGRFGVGRRFGADPDASPVEFEAYDDRFEGGAPGLLAMLDDRVRLLHELLAPHGSMYVHVDPTVGHAVKLLLDDVFGPGCFQREIVWRIGWLSGFKTRARNWIRNHDLIFYYTKHPKQFTFNKAYTPYPEGYVRRDGKPPTGKGVPLEDVWNANEAEFALVGKDSLDSIQIKSFSKEKTGWATQKNEALVRRIIEASSNPGDLVLDAFGGAGTTATVATKSGRRFITCDRSAIAIEIARARLLEAGAAFDLGWVGSRASAAPKAWAGLAAGTPRLAVERTAGRLRLLDLAVSKATREQLVARDIEFSGGLDLVTAWAIEWRRASSSRGGVDESPSLHVDFEAHRTLHRRELVRSAPIPDDAIGARVRVYDVLGQASTVDLEIS